MPFSPTAVLVIKRGFLNGYLMTVLYEAALQMVARTKTYHRFKQPSCQGRMRTAFGTVSLGALSGIKFVAEFEAEGQDGTIEAHFLVETREFSDEALRSIAEARECGDTHWTTSGLLSEEETEDVVSAPPSRVGTESTVPVARA